MALAARPAAHRVRDLVHDVQARCIDDRMHRVEPQTVEVVLGQPEQRVVHKEVAHRAARRTVEIDRRAPRCVPVLAEERLGIEMQVVAVGPEVVVDHVEQHHQPARVRCLHQRLQVIGRAVTCIRCEQQHAVVAPVAPARKVGHRHHLDRRDAQLHQVVEAIDRRDERALRRERADMQFVHHRLVPRAAAPIGVAPCMRARVDQHAGPVHVVGIEARGRIGYPQAAVDAKRVAVAGARSGARCTRSNHRPALASAAAALMRHPGTARPVARSAPTGENAHRLRATGCAPNGMSWQRWITPRRRAATGTLGPVDRSQTVAAAGRRSRGHQRSSSAAAQSRPPMPNASASASTTPPSRIRKVCWISPPPMSRWSNDSSTTKATIA